MAARRKTTTRSGSEIVVVNAGGSPARRSRGGGGLSRRRTKTKGRRRSRGGGGGSGASIQSRLQRVALGGLAYGLIVKHFPQLPSIPAIGRSGTIALAVYFLKPSSTLLQDVGIAAAAIAGASFGEKGQVSGEDDVLSSD